MFQIQSRSPFLIGLCWLCLAAATIPAVGGERTFTLVASGRLDEGESKTFQVRLEAGRSYLFQAVAPEGADFDLVCYDGKRRIAANTRSDHHPFIQVEPPRTGWFQLTLTARRGRGDYVISEVIPGLMLRKGDTDTYRLVLEAHQTYTLFAIGLADGLDVDLQLFDENNDLVAEDDGDSLVSMVEVRPRRTATFRLEVSSGQGAGVYLVSGLRLGKEQGLGLGMGREPGLGLGTGKEWASGLGREPGLGNVLGMEPEAGNAATVLRRLWDRVQRLEAQGYQVIHGQFGEIEAGVTAAFHRELEAGARYQIIGVGDERVDDLDVRVYDPEGDQIAADISANNTPTVEFRSRKAGRYALHVTPYRLASGHGEGFYALVIAYQRGGDSLVSAGGVFMRLLVAVAVQLAEGKRLQHGEMDTVSRGTYRTLEMTLDPGAYSLLGFGDDRITDLDLVVRDEKGNVVARDTAVDNTPMVTFPVRRRGVYRIELKAPGWAWGHSEGFFAVSIAVQ